MSSNFENIPPLQPFAFTISLVMPEDVPDIVDIDVPEYLQHSVTGSLWKTEVQVAQLKPLLIHEYKSYLSRSLVRLICAKENGSKALVGYAMWVIVKPGNHYIGDELIREESMTPYEVQKFVSTSEVESSVVSNSNQTPPRPVAACNDRNVKPAYNLQLKTAQNRHNGTRHFWQLAKLLVDPRYRRKGIGSALLTWGLRQCLSRNIDCYVQSFKSAKGFFLSQEFIEVETLQTPFRNREGYYDVMLTNCMTCSVWSRSIPATKATIITKFESLKSGTASQQHIYKDLTAGHEIRVIKLLPGQQDDIIRCELQVTRLDSQVSYSALSYTWGDAADCLPIECNGVPLWITFNLFTALNRLRHISQIRVLWVDAICIDQSNSAERSAQVKIMREIYKKATKTVVWLGISDEQRDAASFELLQTLKTNQENLTHMDSADTGESELRVLNLIEWDLWPLAWLLQRPWFSRVWVMQEVCVGPPPELLWGRSWSIAWHDLYNIVQLLLSRILRNDQGHRMKPFPIYDCSWVYRIGMLRKMVQQEPNSVNLLVLLLATHKCQSTEARDKIIGVLGMLETIPVDLNSLISYEESLQSLFLSSMCYLLQKFHTLALSLCRDGFGSRNLPSWVPQWDVNVRTSSFLAFRNPIPGECDYYRSSPYRAGGSEIGLIEILNYDCKYNAEDFAIPAAQRPMLRFKAAIVDEIVLCSAFRSTHIDDVNEVRMHVYRAVLDVFLITSGVDHSDYSSGPEIPLEVAYRRACDREPANILLKRVIEIMTFQLIEKGASTESYAEAFEHFFTPWFPIIPAEYSPLSATGQKLAQLNDLCFWIMEHIIGRKFCMTKKSKTGWIPENTIIGDIICIIPGSPVPYILRKANQETDSAREKKYCIVGECFIRGLMSGEAQLQPDFNLQHIILV